MSVPAMGCIVAALVLSVPGVALTPQEASGAEASASALAGALMPGGASEDSAAPDVSGPSVVVGGPCAPPDQERQTGRRVPKVFSWLYRWARGFDIERSTTSPPILYLRSPLLSGFQEPGNCPPSDTVAPVPAASICVAITSGEGTGHTSTWLVDLPQLGARTPAELGSVLRERLESGEKVILRGLGGVRIELDPAGGPVPRTRACDPGTD